MIVNKLQLRNSNLHITVFSKLLYGSSVGSSIAQSLKRVDDFKDFQVRADCSEQHENNNYLLKSHGFPNDAEELWKNRSPKFYFTEFVRQRNRCWTYLTYEHFSRNSLKQDSYYVIRKSWINAMVGSIRRFYKPHKFVSVLRILSDDSYSDSDSPMTWLNAVCAKEMENFELFSHGILPLTYAEDALTLLNFLVVIKERKNIRYPCLTEALVDQCLQYAGLSRDFEFTLEYFETLHRLDDSDDNNNAMGDYSRRAAELLSLKHADFLSKVVIPAEVDNYGVFCYVLTLADKFVDYDSVDIRMTVDRISDIFNKRPWLFKCVHNLGFVCYFLNRCRHSNVNVAMITKELSTTYYNKLMEDSFNAAVREIELEKSRVQFACDYIRPFLN